MFWQRLITGLVLLILAVSGIVFLPPLWFKLCSFGMMLFAAWEWTRLIGLKKWISQALYILMVGLSMLFMWNVMLFPFLMIVGAFWILATYWVWTYPRTSSVWARGLGWRIMMGLLVLVPTWVTLNVIRDWNHGLWILLFLLCLVWSADTGAYFVGKSLGRHRMIPLVSPKKTWEGLAGGVGLSLIIMGLMIKLFPMEKHSWVSFVFLSVITVLFSVVGDLFESMLKRQVGLKDSGNYLPGHGGILDRIDSLTAAAPLFTLLWFLLYGQ